MTFAPAAEKREQPRSPLPVRDAATLILIDRSGSFPKVLLGRRHHAHKFMPGKFVFPGGGVEANDRLMPAVGRLDPRTERRLLRQVARPSRAFARSLALAAIRETCEETGLLIGVKSSEAPAAPDGPWAAFARAHVHPDLAALHFIARAVTPPRQSLRFDTRFFAVDATAIADRIDGITGPDAELVELRWLPIAETAHLDIAQVTHVVLRWLEARIAAGMSHDAPVPFYRTLSRGFMRDLL
jgi:8-oxo-dGTP pyrophosphatase MutT (NUDIX family)